MWRLSRDWIAGALLVLVGLVLLAERQAPTLVAFIPLAVGIGLLALALLVRWPGLLISAGAFIGVGLGVLVARGSDPEVATAAFLVCVGGGLLVAWLLAVLLRIRDLRWRTLLSGVGFIVAGAVVYATGIGATLLRLVVGWWPVVLIAIGAVLLAGARARAGMVDDVDDETAQVRTTRVPEPSAGYAPAPDHGGYAAMPDWAHDQPAPLIPEHEQDDPTEVTQTTWDSWVTPGGT